MAFREQALLEEWKDARETVRHFGNKRFAQLTVFMAASGLMFNHAMSRLDARYAVLVSIVGVILTLLFAAMERASVAHWQGFNKRAVEIEEMEPIPMTSVGDRKKQRGSSFITSTKATYSLYLIIGFGWLLLGILVHLEVVDPETLVRGEVPKTEVIAFVALSDSMNAIATAIETSSCTNQSEEHLAVLAVPLGEIATAIESIRQLSKNCED